METKLLPTDWIYDNIFHLSEDQYEEYRDLIIEDLDREQQFFVFHTEGLAYLVDTQGYTYPRYIVKLNGLEDVTADDYMDLHRMDGLIRIADDQIFNAVVKSLVFELREEDFTLFKKLNDLGYKVKIDMNLSTQVYHIGTFAYGENLPVNQEKRKSRRKK